MMIRIYGGDLCDSDRGIYVRCNTGYDRAPVELLDNLDGSRDPAEPSAWRRTDYMALDLKRGAITASLVNIAANWAAENLGLPRETLDYAGEIIVKGKPAIPLDRAMI